MNNQIVPTYILQAIVDYLESKPYAEVNHLVKAVVEHAKPEPKQESPDDILAESVAIPHFEVGHEAPFFTDSEPLFNDPEPK